MHIWTRIKQLRQEGVSIKKIAKKLNLSKNTVRKYLRQSEPPNYNKNSKRVSQWEAFQKDIKEQATKLLPSVIYENLKLKGAKGGRSSFYEYFKHIKKEIKYSELTMRYETEPGEQGQFDWSDYIIHYKNGETRKVYIISLILGYSRYRFNIASEDVSQISLFQAMEMAFSYFKGVPKILLIDNPKQLITIANKNNFKINKKFKEFAAYYNFRVQTCKARRAETKGKVERPFHYLEEHFIKNNEFEDFIDLSKKLSKFKEKVNNRYHRGIGNIPKDIYQNIEKNTLQRLPARNYFEVFNKEIRKVDHAGTVRYKEVLYSVPVLYSYQTVRIEPVLGHILKIYTLKGQKIAEHKIKQSKGGIVVKREHYEPLLRKERQNFSMVKKEFLRKFPTSESFIEKLKEERKSHYLTDLSKILKISDYYNLEDVIKSFQFCKQYATYSYEFVYAYLKNQCIPKPPPNKIIETSTKLDDVYFTEQRRELSYYDKIRS